jgi:hypothetical protein
MRTKTNKLSIEVPSGLSCWDRRWARPKEAKGTRFYLAKVDRRLLLLGRKRQEWARGYQSIHCSAKIQLYKIWQDCVSIVGTMGCMEAKRFHSPLLFLVYHSLEFKYSIKFILHQG